MFEEGRLCLDDLLSVYSQQAGVEFDCIQLARGRLGYGRSSVTIGDVKIASECVQKPLRVHLCHPPGLVSVSFMLSAGGAAFWRGHEIQRSHALVFDEGENDYILPTGMRSLSVVAPAHAFDSLGLPRPQPGLWRTIEATQRFIIAVGHAALSGHHHSVSETELLSSLCAAMGTEQGALQYANDRKSLNINVFSGSRADAPAIDSGAVPFEQEHIPTRQFQLLLRAEGLGTDLASRSLEAMAEDLATSKRSLHRTFKDLAGLGPQSYLRILRLHRLRQSLVAADSDDTVTRLAYDHGFENMGRLSRQYSDWFDELPRETLRRRHPSAISAQ